MIVIGEALVDLVEEPDGRFDPRLGGAARNVAVALARLGTDVRYAGGIGDDGFAAALRAEFAREGVDIGLAPSVAAPTTLAVVSIGDDGHPSYGFHVAGTSATGVDEESLGRVPVDEPVHVSLGVLTLATPGVGDALQALLRRRGTRTTLTTLDPNARPSSVGDAAYQRQLLVEAAASCAVVRCSDEDLELLAGVGEGAPPPAAIVTSWLDAGATAVVVTAGETGATVTTAHLTVTVEAPRAEVIDTVGAGDTFGAGMLTALLERGAEDRDGVAALDEDGWRVVLGFASAAAAVTVGRRGADPPTRDEVR